MLIHDEELTVQYAVGINPYVSKKHLMTYVSEAGLMVIINGELQYMCLAGVCRKDFSDNLEELYGYT